MATKKKIVKKAVKRQEGTTHTEKPYTKKEMKEIHDLVDKVLLGKVDATPEELQGLVVVTHRNKAGEYLTLGGRRNMSDASSMQLFLRVLDMTPIDGAIMLATINAEQQRNAKMQAIIAKHEAKAKKKATKKK